MFICIPSAQIVAFGGIGYSFKMLNSMFWTASTVPSRSMISIKPAANKVVSIWLANKMRGWKEKEEEHLWRVRHTQISFGPAAHANEWAKIPPTGLHGDPTVQSLRISLMRLAYSPHYNEAAFEFFELFEFCTNYPEAVQTYGGPHCQTRHWLIKSQETTLHQ